MSTDISKICADSLRNFLKQKHGIKLKPSHAHELVAAYFGYKSKNAMLADEACPISDLPKAAVIIMTPGEDIDKRRERLDELPIGLPDSYAMGEAVYEALFSGDIWQSPTPPFKSFLTFARYIVEKSDAFHGSRWMVKDFSMHHVIRVQELRDEVVIKVFRTAEEPASHALVDTTMEITLQRVAGKIGFSDPIISAPIRWSGGAQKTLSSFGVAV